MSKSKERIVTVLLVLCVVAPATTGMAQDKKVELTYTLPDPMFIGTPKALKSPNLEPKRVGKRKPFFVPDGCRNVAAGKAVTSSDMEPIIGELELITDGDKEGTDGSYVELGPMKQYVQIDLEKKYNIYAIVIWHYHSEARVYRDVVIQVADDADFITGVKTLFNNDHDNSSGLGIGTDKEWVDDYLGRVIDAKGLQSRYVRLYSAGSTSSDMNHYVEVEVYGKPAE
jgi:hypothetical protein